MEGLRKAKRAAHRNNNVANSRSLGDVVQPPQGLCYGLPIDLSTESPLTNINCMLFYDDINQSGRKQQAELWPSDVVESTPNRLYSTNKPTGKQFYPCAGRSRDYVPADASTSSVIRYSTPVVIRKVTTTPIVNPYSGTRTFNNPSQGNSTLPKSSPSPMMKQYTGAQKSLLSGGGLMHDGFSGMNPRKRPIPASTASNELATLARADDSSDSKDPHLLIPERFDSFDRFFAVLLRSSAMEYVGAGTGNGASMDLWKTLCDRVQLPLIYKKIASTCVEPKDHFALRASLVLEEARESLSSKLIERRTRRVGQKFSGDSLVKVTVQNIDERNYGITKLRCRGTHGFFSPKEKECLQVGTIFECTDRNSDDDELVFLGCVLPVEQASSFKSAMKPEFRVSLIILYFM